MSKFFVPKLQKLIPYTPGEQPQDKRYVKLNTNESPFPPSPKAIAYAAQAAQELQLYPDPECKGLIQRMAERYGVDTNEVLFTNGSDEILNFAFMAFCDQQTQAAFPEITYGFYSVFADLNGVEYQKIPLQEDFTIRVEDYFGLHKTVFIANPNAPTGICLSVQQLESILQNNPENVVVIDEAYVDFGAESCVPLIHRYDNLLVVQTFSKSRSMAGARLGMCFGCKELIRDLNTVKYSVNPYNINRMTMAAGIGVLEDEEYTRQNCKEIIAVRQETASQLKNLGFSMTDSIANFLFVRHADVDGKQLYLKLKEKGVLIRHFDAPRLSQYNRITIGNREQMQVLISTIKDIMEEIQ